MESTYPKMDSDYLDMKNKMIRILYFDDEVNNLNAFKATFRREFDIYLASTIVEARKLMREVAFHIVIADQRMPDITGVEFFHLIKDKYPDSIRILLTAYTDTADIINAINKGHIYSFIKKPWDENELHNAIRSASEIYIFRKRLENKIIELNKASMEFNRFMDGISTIHSLLLSIIGMMNLVKTDTSIVDSNGYLKSVESNLRQGERYLLSILDYHHHSRKQSQNEILYFHPLIEECITPYRNRSDRKISIFMDVQQDGDFYGDLYRLNLIIDKIIKNAIAIQKRDTPEVKIEIRAKVNPEKADLQIDIGGVGLSQEEIDRMFKVSFLTLGVNKENDHIELYLVKEALERMDGEITVSSSGEQDVQFVIRIPNQNRDIF